MLALPPYARGTVWANGTAGAQDFTTEVSSPQMITAERAMYWPTGSGARSAGQTTTADGTTTASTQAWVGDPPSPYTLTEGTPGPTVEALSPAPDVVIGQRPPSQRNAPQDAAGTQSTSSLPWYGSHLALGKKP